MTMIKIIRTVFLFIIGKTQIHFNKTQNKILAKETKMWRSF